MTIIVFSIFWLEQIKEKYIHGGDEEFDSCRNKAIDIAINKLEKDSDIVRCKDCTFRGDVTKCIVAHVIKDTGLPLFMFDKHGEWYCADGRRKDV